VTPELTKVAEYERSVGASIERVWENVRDWEHLPWLHAGSFRAIDLIEEAPWGWHARIGLPPEDGPEIELELVIESDRRYVSRTLAGIGAGGEIWTTLQPRGPERTDVHVEFWLPEVPEGAADRLGAAYTALYTRLWDEDEDMMRERTRALARRDAPAEARAEPLELGTLDELRARLPLVVELAGRRFRVVGEGEELVVHSAVCPHRLGPLDACALEDGTLTCPWHGYRFDAHSGRQLHPAGGRLRLAPAPRVEVVDGRVRLVPT
jgi:nitrite reductase/ring-hydroxylating ferredoxin subunit